MREWTVKSGEKDQRFSKYLQRRLPGAPSSFLYKMLRKKNITLNGKKASGNPVVELQDGLLPAVGRTRWTGTRINFLPDPEIFEKTRFREEDIKSRMHETAYLNPELTIEYTDKRQEPAEELVFHEPDGIVGFIRALNKSKEAVTDIIYFKGLSDQITVEAAFQFVNEFHENVLGNMNARKK